MGKVKIDKDVVLQALNTAGSLRGATLLLGVSRNVVRRHVRKYKAHIHPWLSWHAAVKPERIQSKQLVHWKRKIYKDDTIQVVHSHLRLLLVRAIRNRYGLPE